MSMLKAVVFDWAGTTIDFGSRAPMGAFVEVFREFGVEIAVEEARRPMGLPKWDHIRALGDIPRIADAWRAAHGAAFSDKDADRIHEVFEPLNARVVTDFAELIPGTLEAVETLRGRGVKIGSTTGYTRAIMQPLLPKAAEQGYAPDNLVCAGDLPVGRPTPSPCSRRTSPTPTRSGARGWPRPWATRGTRPGSPSWRGCASTPAPGCAPPPWWPRCG